jgi:hypothetical protein
MGLFSGIKKAFKKVTKGIGGAIKKVGKAIAKVGKKVVKGIKNVASKLGPVLPLAMMFIPGMQAFANGLWSGMGVTGAVAQKALTSAAVSFIGSGGDLKAAVVGGALGGLGAAAGGVKEAMAAGQSFGDAVSTSLSAQSSITSFGAGMAEAKAQWGNFTNDVSDFFSSNSPTGDVTEGANKTFVETKAYDPSQLTEAPDSAMMEPVKQPQAYQDVDFTDQELMQQEVAQATGITPEGQQAQMLAEQQLGFGDAESLDMLAESASGGTPTYMAKESWMDKIKENAKSLLTPNAASTGISQPAFITSVASSDLNMGKTGSGFGTAGQLGLTPEQRQLQAQLVAQIEQQQELARRKAQAGWGIA